jgi:hypothetical protein
VTSHFDRSRVPQDLDNTPVLPSYMMQVPVSDKAKLYPRQVNEVNRVFDRIKQQFVSHKETQAILGFARAFLISLGVHRNDSPKILGGLQNIVHEGILKDYRSEEEVERLASSYKVQIPRDVVASAIAGYPKLPTLLSGASFRPTADVRTE